MVPDAIIRDCPVPAIGNTIVTAGITYLWYNPDRVGYGYLIACMKRSSTLIIPFIYTYIILMGVDKERIIKIHTIASEVNSHAPFAKAVTTAAYLGSLKSKLHCFVELPNILSLEDGL